MNAKIHPLVATLVILLTLAAIGIWMWGTGKAKSLGGPAELRLGPDGHLFIQIQNQLLEHDANGVYLRRHDLGDLGVNVVLGSIALFSNGDILLRRGPDPRTLPDNIRAYQRKTNQHALDPETPESGLFRCSLGTKDCTRFGSPGIDFKAATSLFIDWETDDVYISDTTRHLLRKFSAEGVALTEPVTGFKFPNQLVIDNDLLYVANTNYHEVRIVDPATKSFGTEIAAIDVVPSTASAADQVWPSHLARVGDDWWVNNMRTGMNEGGIYVFDKDWQYDGKVSLPANADPIALLAFRDGVLISDWDNDRIYRVSTDGIRRDDFVSAGLDEVLEESRAERRKFNALGYSGIGFFVLILGGLLARGFATQSSDRSR